MILNEVKRIEAKYFIKESDLPLIIDVLSTYMVLDENCKEIRPYQLTSLYFDDVNDKDLRQKLDGVIRRKKYRLRFYNRDFSNGKFEIKRKAGITINKSSIAVQKDDIAKIVEGEYACLFGYGCDYEVQELFLGNYKPKSIVTYDRLAFYLPYNNIRVTLDLHLRTHGYSLSLENHLNEGISINPKGHQIIEIKYSDSIPDGILRELSKFSLSRTAISKYASARLFSHEENNIDLPYFAW